MIEENARVAKLKELLKISEDARKQAMKADPDAYFKKHVHLLFDHYLVYTRDKTYMFNGGEKQMQEFQDKLLNLIKESAEAEREACAG